MDIGHFYFISDQYYRVFPDNGLMHNKESENGTAHDRPCFYAFFDETTMLFWMIPISSRVEKYKEIWKKKMQKFGSCDTIVFGEVLGRERAFLIQNMCPVTERYIIGEYKDSKTGLPVRIESKLEKELAKRARRILALQRNGHKIVFPDIEEIERLLRNP